MANNLQTVFDRYKYDISATKKSKDWYQQQVNKLRNKTTPSRMMREQPSQLRGTIVPGNMYMYFYDPLTKETLPYYDMFPLVFPYRRVGGNFWGLNFHYIPPVLRVKILDRLMTYKTNDKMDGTTRLRLSWNLISSAASLKPLQACVRQYRFDQVQSRFLKVDPNDWVTAMLLPVESFIGDSKSNIWREGRERYGYAG